MEGEFFDPGSLMEESASLSGWDEVPCPGASSAEQRAEDVSGLIRGETRPGLTVSLTETDASFEPTKTIFTTQSDALGRFCFKIPSNVSVGPALLLVADHSPRLRRVVLDEKDANIGEIHEALIQLLIEHRTPIRAPLLINLHTVAQTAVDLLNDPLESAGRAEPTVDSLKTELIADPRTRELLGAPDNSH